ncbi:MAG: hypothetical protein EXS13_05030 [Planctomycetes bacterium]|nr:hypothetical protein [Planctomycetota bacterium]
MPTSIAAGCMFVSGTAALLYEVLWVRDLGYTFGGSAEALSAVVAAFLAGLALGAFVAGRRVRAQGGLLKVYAILELVIALYAPLAPWVIAKVDTLFLSELLGASGGAGALAPRFALTFVALLPATACMGATLPVLCTAFSGGIEKTGALIGRLYGWNTLGGVLGCLLAGFILVEKVGLWRSRCIAALLNLLLAALAWRLAPALDAAFAARSAKNPARGKGTRPTLNDPPRVRLPWLAWAGALIATSAFSITLEFGWTRLMALGVGGTTYAFSIVLALYLAGLGCGALAYSALAGRGARPLPTLIAAQLLLALLLLVVQPFLDEQIARIGVVLFEATNSIAGNSAVARGRLALEFGAQLVLLPALLLGIAFPALADLRVGTRDEIGRGLGSAYLLSTMGGVAASLATHFWLMPRCGLEELLTLAAIGCGTVGALLLAVRGGWRNVLAAGGLLLAIAAGGFALHDHGRWDPRAIYGGVGLYGADALKPDRKLLSVRDGASCSVAVFQQKDERSLAVNGKVDATSRGDMGTQLLLAWLPQLLARDSKEVFVLGYGAGVTAAAAARYGGAVICAEIEAEVLAASHWFAAVNDNAHADPRITLVTDDGRALLRRAPQRFDVITTEPSNPWLAGMASLFTVEFYELCRERLAAGGVLCQWVQLYWSSPDDYQAIFATLGSVFPHVAIWKTTSGDTLMLGAMEPLLLDPAALAKREQERPWLAPKLAGSGGGMAGASIVAQLARMALLCGDDARVFADAGPRRIRDDVPFLEFSAARNMQANSGDSILQRVFAARRTPLYQWESVAAALSPSERAPLLRDVSEQLLKHGGAALAEPLLAEARSLAPGLERLPFWWWLAAKKRGAADEAVARLAELEQSAPGLLLGVCEEQARDRSFDAAQATLDRLEKRLGMSAESVYLRGTVLHRMGRKGDAATQYERALRLDPKLGRARDAMERLRDGK